KDSDFKDSIDQSVLTHCDGLFIDPTPEMFIEEQPPDYSFPSRFDVYPDDFLEIESDATFDDNYFDSEGEKIKEAELLIDQLDLPCDILSEYDSFNSQDFSRDDVLFSPDNKDKVFNPGILSHEKSVKIITHVTQEKKLAVSFASWLFEDFDPPFYELLVFKEVPNSMRILPFSSKNEEKVFKPGIYTFEKFHCCFLLELSHPCFPVFKVKESSRKGQNRIKTGQKREAHASSRKYTTSVTKTKAADYGNIKWIEDLVPHTMWIQEPINYDKHALWGVFHWGQKRQQFYGFAVNQESVLDVYSKRRIIAVTDLKIMEWHSYKHLDWISIRRDDDKIYKFKEGDFKRLCLQNIEDMLLLLVQGKLSNLTVEECFAFNVSLRMFTRSIIIQRRVEDLQLGVKRYQKRLNLTKPDTYRSDLKQREAYTAYSNPIGLIYQNKDKKNRLMRIDELYKFSDGTLNDVCNALDDCLKGIRMQYLPQTI
nr:hypothetical protein [Tanacetum cinerariifolium]